VWLSSAASGSELPERLPEDLRARLAEPDAVRDHDRVEVLEQLRLLEQGPRGRAVAEVRDEPEPGSPADPGEHLGVMLDERRLLPQGAHVDLGQDVGEVGSVQAERLDQRLEASPRRELPSVVPVAVADLPIHPRQRPREVLEVHLDALHNGVVQASISRAVGPAVDLDLGEALQPEVHERVEQIEEHGSDRHPARIAAP
jgi:hypothetical protein